MKKKTVIACGRRPDEDPSVDIEGYDGWQRKYKDQFAQRPRRSEVGIWLLDHLASTQEIVSWETLSVNEEYLALVGTSPECILIKLYLTNDDLPKDKIDGKIEKLIELVPEIGPIAMVLPNFIKSIQEPWQRRAAWPGSISPFSVKDKLSDRPLQMYLIGLDAPGRIPTSIKWSDDRPTDLQLGTLNEKRAICVRQLSDWIES